MALPAGRYGVTKNQLFKIKKLPMNTIKLIEELTEKFDLLGTAAFKNSTSVVTESSDLVESGAVLDTLRDAEVVEGKNYNIGDSAHTFVKNTARIFRFPLSIPIVSGQKYKFVANISNISGYSTQSALIFNIASNGVNISPLYTIKTTDTGQIVFEITASNNGTSDNYIYCFITNDEADNATITLTNVMVLDGNENDYTYEPYYVPLKKSKADNSVIGTVEDGTNPTKSYAVGEHFIRNGKFCTCIVPVTTASTWSDSYYVEGDVASALDVITTTASDLVITKCNKFVTVNYLHSVTITAGTTAQIGDIPSGFRPSFEVYGVAITPNADIICRVAINASGNVFVRSISSFSGVIGFNISYSI